MCVASLGLMVVTGFTGQISFGHAAFVAIGAYTHTLLLTAGVPFIVVDRRWPERSPGWSVC